MDSEKTLTISGTGEMYDYGNESPRAPWTRYDIDDFENVIIENGVTSIGNGMTFFRTTVS